MQKIFPFSCEFDVRGYEIDQFGHVNNAVYLNWLEQARWELSARHDFRFFQDVLPVVRNVSMDYRSETVWGDRVRVTIWPRMLGTTSFSYGNSIRIVKATVRPEKREGQLAMVAHTVFVCVQGKEGKVPVPEKWRTYFEKEDPGEKLPPEA